jgi:hypothetical protein
MSARDAHPPPTEASQLARLVARLARPEALTAAAVLAVAFLLRVAYSLRQDFDSDEPQHFHVAWGWSQGLAPYRDFFDNHTPLFHVLAAPIVAAIGERPEALLWMRLAMLPLVALLLWCLYRIGAALFSPRTGVWAAALTSILPPFLLLSVEFRADVLWATLWLASLAVWAAGPLTVSRGLAIGLLFGTTLAASVKTVLLVPTFFAAWSLVSMLDRDARAATEKREARLAFVAIATGLAIVCGAMLGLLAARGVLTDFFDCVLAHNLTSITLWHDRAPRLLLFGAALPLVLFFARALLARSHGAVARRGVILFLATALYALMLNSFWPMVHPQDFLPLAPLAVLLVVALALPLAGKRPRAGLLAALAALGIVLTLFTVPLREDGTRFQLAVVSDALRLVGPRERVMDLKGEFLFRRRAVFHAFENVTSERIRLGSLADDIAERVIATRTYVSIMDNSQLPPAGRRFLLENFVAVGHVRVAGKHLAVDPLGVSRFQIQLPGRYAILSPRGPAAGVLDGGELSGSRFLEPGDHTFRPIPSAAPLALVWADAAEKGYSPFRAIDP